MTRYDVFLYNRHSESSYDRVATTDSYAGALETLRGISDDFFLESNNSVFFMFNSEKLNETNGIEGNMTTAYIHVRPGS